MSDPKCIPSNFINGRYIFRECEECGNDYIPEDEDDTVCEECAHIVSGNETDFVTKPLDTGTGKG